MTLGRQGKSPIEIDRNLKQACQMDFVLLGDIGTAETRITAPLERRILAVLLAKRNRSVSQDYLIDAIWAGFPPEHASDSLFSKISRLRRVIGTERIERSCGGYRLCVHDSECDASRFEAAAHDALRSMSPEASDHALALWKDPVFAEFADELFATNERLRLEELRDEVEIHRMELLLADGSPGAIVAADSLARRLCLNERVAMSLAAALASTGRHVEAVRSLTQFRDLLAEETGLVPSPEFALVERRLLSCESSTRRALMPNQVWPSASVPERARVPHYRTPIVGRVNEVAHLLEALRERRLVTVVGEGGIGKTRVAAELASRSLAEGRQVVWCTLDAQAGVDKAGLGRRLALAATENVADQEAEFRHINDDDVIDHLADANLLFVLDECERVVGPLGDVIGDLLQRDGAQFVVTSRVPLRLPEEHVIRLDGLPTDGPHSLAAAFLRSRLPSSIGEIDDRELGALAEMTGGMPLALELLAVRLADIPAETMLAMLRDRLPVMEPVARGHNRSLRHAIAWSYESLTPGARSLFRALSTLADGFDLDLLATIGGGMDDGRRGGVETVWLTELLDHSLVRRSPLDPDRYEMLRPIADAGLALIVEQGDRELSDRHMVHAVIGFLRRAANGRLGTDAEKWIVRAERESPNVRFAFHTAMNRGWTADAAEITELQEPEARLVICK
jgi:predicted ATPase/DNA-binding SARP family transcriptional activator